MGNKPTLESKQKGHSDQSTLQKQYRPPFELLHKNPHFFTDLMKENETFSKNLFTMFPDSHKNFEAFFEMVMYLRREDGKFTLNPIAVENRTKTTLLDRFFMIILNITAFKDYETKQLSISQADEMLIHYFSLFTLNPQKGTILKVLAFFKHQSQTIGAKHLSSTFREYFPSVQKYLKDYYYLKFNKLEKEGHLMKNFSSKIISNDAILLAMKIPRLSSPQIVELYNTQKYGIGFHSIEKKMVGYTGPWMMLVEHVEKNEKGEKETYVFGTYQNGPIKNVLTYQGDVTGFLFTIHPQIRFFTTDKGDNGNHYYYINSIPEQKSKRRMGFGFGGNNDKQHFKLWIDEDLDKSSVFNGKDSTYGYGCLAGSGTERLSVRRIEVWGLGSQHNIQDQVDYWKEREEEINKRRKVDKKEFMDGNAELFFGNTFAHREQVVGQIQKSSKKEEEEKK